MAPRGPVAQATGDKLLPLYISLPPLFRAHLQLKKSRKKKGVRRSEAAKPCRILDLRYVGNCLLLIYEINYVLDCYIDILLSILVYFIRVLGFCLIGE